MGSISKVSSTVLHQDPAYFPMMMLIPVYVDA